MNKQQIFLPAGLALTAMLSACALIGGGAATAPPPPAEAIAPHAIMTDTPTPTPGGKVGSGEIVYVSNGKLMAIGADGSNSRSIYAPAGSGTLHDLAVSPDGHYLAFATADRMMVLDLELGQINTIATSPTDHFGSPVWSLAGDAVYYHQMVIGDNSKPVRSQVMLAKMPPGSVEPLKILSFDLTSNMPILPAAAWRGGLLLLHQSDLSGGSLGQWLVYDPDAQSVAPLLKDYGLWDVSPDRTLMLLFHIPDLAGGPGSPSVPIFSARLDLLKGAVSGIRLVPEEVQVHIEAGHYGPDGRHIAALQYVNVDGGVRRQVVLMSPASGDKYAITRLAPDDASDDVLAIWGGAGLIVQRMRAGQPELWNIPLDGSAGTLFASGEQPVVVPAR